MNISAQSVKALRDRTGAGMMDAKKALIEADGNEDNAIDILRKKGLSKAGKKSGRTTSEGLVTSYIHGGGRIGVLLEVNCESDFVARTEDFQNFCTNIAMHIAASFPEYVSKEDVPKDIIAKEIEIYEEEAKNSGKPAEIAKKIADGKLNVFYKERCLLMQEYIKDPSKSIEEYLNETISKLGENMQIHRFSRFQIGG